MKWEMLHWHATKQAAFYPGLQISKDPSTSSRLVLGPHTPKLTLPRCWYAAQPALFNTSPKFTNIPSIGRSPMPLAVARHPQHAALGERGPAESATEPELTWSIGPERLCVWLSGKSSRESSGMRTGLYHSCARGTFYSREGNRTQEEKVREALSYGKKKKEE